MLRRYFTFFYLSSSVYLSFSVPLFITFGLTLSSPSFFLCSPLVDLWYPLTLAPCRAVSYTIGPDASLTDSKPRAYDVWSLLDDCPQRCRNVIKKCLKRRVNNIIKYF